MSEDLPRVLAGRYRLLSPLGEGGTSTVRRAWDESLDRAVAIRDVVPPAWMPAESRELWLRRIPLEMRPMTRVKSHSGIVAVHDVVEEDGLPWIVMDLVEGPSLARVIETEGRLDEVRVAEIGLQVITALAWMSETYGILHQDVRPSNILFEDGRVMLTGFWISAVVRGVIDCSFEHLTDVLPYLAPERILSQRPSTSADLWAMGVTLYEAVEGRRPFEEESTMGTLAAVVFRPPAPTRYADRLRPVIEGLLRKDPAERLTVAQATALLSQVATEAPLDGPSEVATGAPPDGPSQMTAETPPDRPSEAATEAPAGRPRRLRLGRPFSRGAGRRPGWP
ncbi:serine/threonine protein kinase [Streptosporangium becharense]|uniref:non-specific serine/threonine protein kinase n=1 Tax=Streptosporangium becharense TaxID=1816182 RepID=A0A7W9IJ40_9ACTN|nr:serine/threonine-protein kinase [Streptosporangium becharense]MBB2911287.1 serine/threonine protein kinase [Streptosporangium becharense]MBB5821655.1 serine/threonine protein kinase [Streptosporangium becharense]